MVVHFVGKNALRNKVGGRVFIVLHSPGMRGRDTQAQTSIGKLGIGITTKMRK